MRKWEHSSESASGLAASRLFQPSQVVEVIRTTSITKRGKFKSKEGQPGWIAVGSCVEFLYAGETADLKATAHLGSGSNHRINGGERTPTSW